jgi:hypothetical protein
MIMLNGRLRRAELRKLHGGLVAYKACDMVARDHQAAQQALQSLSFDASPHAAPLFSV